MENNFDKEVKKLLENYKEEQPMDWDRMDKMIEEDAHLNPELDDLYLDGIVYDSLHNLEEPYNPAHWDLMKEKLTDPYALRSRLLKYKVAEVALVLLFIFTLVQFLPFKKIRHQDIASNNTIQKTEISAPEGINKADKVSTKPSVSEHQSGLDSQASGKASTRQNLPGVYLPPPINEIGEENNAAINDFFETQVADEITAIPERNTDMVEERIDGEAVIAESSIVKDPTASETFINTDLLQPIFLKEADKLSVPGIEALSGSTVFSDLKRPIEIRIGMVFGPDANYVMTSANEAQSLASFDQFALGYSGGFSLGFKYNKWEIETGALYSSLNYDSRNIFEINGSFAEGGYVQQGLVGAELDLIRLPLNVKFNFSEKKKWNIYALSGVSLNMAVETFYKFSTQDVGESDASRNFAFPNPRVPDDYREQFNRPSYDGILEGGKFSTNSFLTANIGFGIERYFTPRLSIFLQPSYMHQFSKGLGPQSDQINSFSILTGAKVTLKKRKKLKK
ncbi:MAG: hypothetical protein ACI8P3_003903 [Saprospiraceae bacterium]|jgi:hypothetical protein